MPLINRTQALVLGFVAASLAILVAILLIAPELYDTELRPLGIGGNQAIRLGFLVAIGGLVAVVGIATVRRSRWAFWLILVAFAAGVLRVPVFALQLFGLIPLEIPLWYAGLQAAVGLAQVAIAVAMWRGYRRAGPWGEA
jgi:hypothetical protein